MFTIIAFLTNLILNKHLIRFIENFLRSYFKISAIIVFYYVQQKKTLSDSERVFFLFSLFLFLSQ